MDRRDQQLLLAKVKSAYGQDWYIFLLLLTQCGKFRFMTAGGREGGQAILNEFRIEIYLQFFMHAHDRVFMSSLGNLNEFGTFASEGAIIQNAGLECTYFPPFWER